LHGLLDAKDLSSGATGGVDLRWLCGGAGGSGRVNRGLVKALNKARPWPAAKVGMARASRSC